MTPPPSDVASITHGLSRWELAEYISCGLVTIACFGEFIAEFTNWFTGGSGEKKDRLARLSTLLLVVSLAFELICLVKTNQISGKLIGSLDEKAEEASQKSERAITDANSAESLAHGARQEADSFEKDIVSAKEQAASAESHLSEALRRAAQATAALDRLKAQIKKENTPRSFNPVDVAGIVAKLKQFAGTPYDFAVYDDPESIGFMDMVDEVLHQAGWIRKPPTMAPGIIGLTYNVSGPDSAAYRFVPLTTTVGVSVNYGLGQYRPANELMSAIHHEGIGIKGMGMGTASTVVPIEQQPPIHITVGKKEQAAPDM